MRNLSAFKIIGTIAAERRAKGGVLFHIITDRSKAILLLWFYLFCDLESIFVLFEPYVRFHISLSSGN